MSIVAKDFYRASNAWFTCDRCSQRWRRSTMKVEWTGLRVCGPCLDPVPPTLFPPNVGPEGVAFPDARPPQDRPDRLTDDTSLFPLSSGIKAVPGLLSKDIGAISPLPIITILDSIYAIDDSLNQPINDSSGTTINGSIAAQVGPEPLTDQVTIITGFV